MDAARLATAIAVVMAPAALAGPIVDFEKYDDSTPLENGRQLSTVNGLYEQGLFTLTSTSDNTNGGGRGAIFNSSDTGPNAAGQDPDLLVNLGNILIVQRNDGAGALTQSTAGIYDTPNDDAQGGTLIFDFTNPSHLDTIDLIDINGGGALTITLRDTTGKTRTFSIPDSWTNDINAQGPAGFDKLNLRTLAPQDGEGPGGNATAVETPGFDETIVNRMTVAFGGSAGLDNLVFVPSPGLMSIGGIGLLGLVARRRR